jgi:hypothetical protein
MMKNPFLQFADAHTIEQQQVFQQEMLKNGFSSFYKFLEGFKDLLKNFHDEEIQKVENLLHLARQLFPNPSQMSPSWDRVWHEFEEIIQIKQRVLAQIKKDDRPGEWQIVMDNPFTSQEVVCYPSLAFIEAAYLYAYFFPQLEKNEYLRLQKVQTLIMDYHPFESTEKVSSQKIDWD